MGMQDRVGAALKGHVPTVGLADSLPAAIRTMAKAGSSALIVVDGGEVLGIVSELDLVHSVNRGGDPATIKVSEVMTACRLISNKAVKSPCVQLDEDENVATALQIMEEAGVHHMLVSGAAGKVVGVATAADLLVLAIS